MTEDSTWLPRLHVKENAREIVVEVWARGLRHHDVEVEVRDGFLFIQGTKLLEGEMEPRFFIRTVPIIDPVDATGAAAVVYASNVEVRLPKIH